MYSVTFLTAEVNELHKCELLGVIEWAEMLINP